MLATADAGGCLQQRGVTRRRGDFLPSGTGGDHSPYDLRFTLERMSGQKHPCETRRLTGVRTMAATRHGVGERILITAKMTGVGSHRRERLGKYSDLKPGVFASL